MRGEKIVVHDLMQSGYEYVLSENEGENFDPEFCPELTPKEMLELGVFGGKYMTDCTGEFPADWFEHAKLKKAICIMSSRTRPPIRQTMIARSLYAISEISILVDHWIWVLLESNEVSLNWRSLNGYTVIRLLISYRKSHHFVKSK